MQLIVSALLLIPALATPGLEAHVAAYWDLLAGGDKAAALAYVTPETRNNFINRREPEIVSWTLLETTPVSTHEFRVRVKVERRIPGLPGVFPIDVEERWVQREQWQVEVETARAPLALLGEVPRQLEPVPDQIMAYPQVMKIPFLNPRRLGSVYLANGLRGSVAVKRIEYDHQRFRLLSAPEVVASGEIGRLGLEFIGEENGKNLSSSLRVTVEGEGTIRSLEIPITYNYFSQGARGLFGLSSEQAEKLVREDRLEPAVSTPAVDKALKERRRRKPGPVEPRNQDND